MKFPLALDGTPVALHPYVPDVDAVIACAVDADAMPVMPAADMFWGDRYGLVRDPYGRAWSIATHVRGLSDDAIRAVSIQGFSGV